MDKAVEILLQRGVVMQGNGVDLHSMEEVKAARVPLETRLKYAQVKFTELKSQLRAVVARDMFVQRAGPLFKIDHRDDVYFEREQGTYGFYSMQQLGYVLDDDHAFYLRDRFYVPDHAIGVPQQGYISRVLNVFRRER